MVLAIGIRMLPASYDSKTTLKKQSETTEPGSDFEEQKIPNVIPRLRML
jgi:hypothetical protein